MKVEGLKYLTPGMPLLVCRDTESQCKTAPEEYEYEDAIIYGEEPRFFYGSESTKLAKGQKVTFLRNYPNPSDIPYLEVELDNEQTILLTYEDVDFVPEELNHLINPSNLEKVRDISELQIGMKVALGDWENQMFVFGDELNPGHIVVIVRFDKDELIFVQNRYGYGDHVIIEELRHLP